MDSPAHRLILFGVLSLATVSATVLPAVPAFAQSSEEIERAKQAFREGKKFYNDEQFDQAAAAFSKAYELSGRSELLYNIGQSYRFAGDLRKAEEYLQRYLSESDAADNADDVVELIVELQQQIAAQLATVQVETAVEGRSVYVDDDLEPRCTTPCSVTVQPGPHTVVIKGDGGLDAVEEVNLDPGKTLQLKTRLQDAVVKGRLMLQTDRPGGIVRVGDHERALPLQQPVELPVGEYPVRVESARKATWRGQVTIEPNYTTELFVPMQSLVEARKRGSLRKALAYGFWGVSAAAATGGILMALQTQNTFDALVEQRERHGFVDADLKAQGQSQQAVTNVMLGIAGGAVVTGIALFVWDEFATEKDPEPRARPSDELVNR